MKKALTITLTLILGVFVNEFICVGLFALGFLAYGYFERSEYVAAAVGIVVFAVLLCFLAVILKNIVNGALFILCAQIPSVIRWAICYRESFSDKGSGYDFGLTISVSAMFAALIMWAIFSNKDRLKKWWNEPL